LYLDHYYKETRHNLWYDMAKNNHALIHGISININPSTDLTVCVMDPGQQLTTGWTC